MARRPDPDDDDFDDIYKEYTGPLGSTATNAQEKEKTNKRSHASSDEEEEPRDPNAVPTDFTSREAKVWEAKSKATERNWKKRKEEEMICKICGESGHFTQGCPSTLGANRKSQDFFERVAAREKHVKALFTEKVIQKIEKDIGCKIKMEEKFIIVSGKDRLVLAKGVDAVHKMIKEEGSRKGSSSSHMNRSRSPERSPGGPRFGHSESQRSFPSPQKSQFQQRLGRQEKLVEDPQRSFPSPQKSQFQQRLGRQEKLVEDPQRPFPSPQKSQFQQRLGRQEKLVEDPQRSFPSPQKSQFQQRLGRHDKLVEDRVREDLQKLSRGSSQAYGNDGARGRSSHSKSPAPHPYTGNSYNSYDSHGQSIGVHRTDGWETERGGSDMRSGHKLDNPAFTQTTLEELELEYKREAMDLSRNRDKEEDEENYKHREAVREIRENYMKKLAILRGMHANQWEEFLQLDAQRRQERAHKQMSNSGYGDYKQPNYPEYDSSSANPHYAGANLSMDSRSRYQQPMENYPSSRVHDTYSDFQRQRREDYGKSYNRY